MEKQTSCCCGSDSGTRKMKNCAVCGKPLLYFTEEKQLECRLCHQMKPANAACTGGHFICDDCHSGGGAAVLDLLLHSDEKDPVALFLKSVALEDVHLHGPEHHSIVPCVLLTAYRNNGGSLDLEAALREAWKRGKKMAGGSCGYLGVCGAAAGAGIFVSILTGATPLTGEKWVVPQRLTAACLEALAEVGGPRCCKRTGRIAIETAAVFSEREFGVAMPCSRPKCRYSMWNAECIKNRCPFFSPGENEG